MTHTSSAGKTAVEALDLMSIVKTSQALSGEVDLKNLLTRVMQCLMKNAGAQRCLLILKRKDSFMVEAAVSMDQRQVSFFENVTIDDSDLLAASIAQYVARTGKEVVLNDAAQEGMFTRDASVLRKKLLSVLCMPILHQGKLIGLLYLENNEAKGAFTRLYPPLPPVMYRCFPSSLPRPRSPSKMQSFTRN